MNHPVSFPRMAATSTQNPSAFVHFSPSPEIRTESLLAPRQLQRPPSGKQGNFHVQIFLHTVAQCYQPCRHFNDRGQRATKSTIGALKKRHSMFFELAEHCSKLNYTIIQAQG